MVDVTRTELWRLVPHLAAQFFQLIKTGSALADVGQQLANLSIHGLLGKPPKGVATRTVDALRIGKVFVHDAVKRVVQLFVNIHFRTTS